MITVIAHYRVDPADAEAVRELLARHSAASESEPGCLRFAAHQDADDSGRFALYEQYVDAEAFAAHRRTPHFVTNIEQTLVPILLQREWRTYGEPL